MSTSLCLERKSLTFKLLDAERFENQRNPVVCNAEFATNFHLPSN